MGRGATSPEEITGICISPDRDGGTRPRRRGEAEEEEAAICLSQASGTLSPRRPPHIPPFQDLSVSSPSSHHCTIFAACLHFCQQVTLFTSADIFLSCFLRGKTLLEKIIS